MVKIEVTKRLKECYPQTGFHALLVEGTSNKSNKELSKEINSFMENLNSDYLKKKEEELKKQEEFHIQYNKSFPLRFQLQTLIKSKQFSTESALKDLLFLMEMKHCSIISGHDVSKLKDTLTFDISPGGERFNDIRSNIQNTKKNDIVLRDGDELITSLVYGPGVSTKITESTTDCLYLFWYYNEPESKQLNSILSDVKLHLEYLKPKLIEEIQIKQGVDSTFVVTPWDVSGKVDYDKLIKEFGVQMITDEQRSYLRELAKKKGMDEHIFLKRNLFFAQMDLGKAIDAHKQGKPLFLYTGRAPGGSMHVGHLIPFMFTKYLQDLFDCNLYIQIPDDEKMLFKKDLTREKVDEMMKSDLDDIAAFGFDPEKTFLFKNTEYVSQMYPLVLEIAKRLTFSQARNIFGFTNESNVGQMFYPAMQIFPSQFEKGQCLIPCAIDQNPYFLLQRDIAPKIGYLKNATILSKFLTPLTGAEGKMSASDSLKAILLTDTAEEVKKKVNKYAFSGGGATLEEHKEKGANLDVDVSYQWLYYLFEEDDKEIERIAKEYGSGTMMTGEIKKIVIDKINEFLENHRTNKENAQKKNVLKKYMVDGKLAQEAWKKKFI